MSHKMALGAVMILSMGLNGCGSLLYSGQVQTKYVATVRPFCKAAHPICIDDADRFIEPTAQQLDANNRGLKSHETASSAPALPAACSGWLPPVLSSRLLRGPA